MKNIFLSLAVFVAMSLLHTQFTDWEVGFLKLPGGSYGMFSVFMLIFCSVITGIGLLTAVIFRKTYYSILRMAVLFEIIYLLFLIISGNNPFLYFYEATNENLLMIMVYGNAVVVFIIMYLVHLLYSKINSSADKK
ncbi:hypothetical protein FY557_18195 [Chryseobacterium sp. SN22]|uniref:hypothetical protein n=1 Tax=Chryseobacterium sp. SN22 TaxID=2606431 RepID=UPI0011EE765C|nr:hypothetical protein [Chryseobacterium sp. SN22]KAA0126284.1 hypothetical protein FY557_18195 [Chryseobacterium sp. SN22]